jgi:hypothetical protein
LYALERLGQNNPELRRTVIDVICAYLRMPYTPPVEVLRSNAQRSPYILGKDDPDPEPKEQPARREELQVRLTAQRLLRDHTNIYRFWMGDEPPTYWRDSDGARMSLDLTGAVLVSLDLSTCQLGTVRFDGAQFHGDADLGEAQFHGDAFLDSVQFHGDADLGGVLFFGDANLAGAQFHGNAILDSAQFQGYADLIGALPSGWTLAPANGETIRFVIRTEPATEASQPQPSATVT